MREGEDTGRAGPGCLVRLAGLFVLIILGCLGFAMYEAGKPQDLRDIVPSGEAARDLGVILENAQEGGYMVEFTDREVNGWLEEALDLEQGGVLGDWVQMNAVRVRFTEGLTEVVMERQVFGYVFTTSVYVQIERVETPKGSTRIVKIHGGRMFDDLPVLTKGGRIGSLTVPQGFLRLYLEDFQKLVAALEAEIGVGVEEMPGIEVFDGKVQLDPRYANSESIGF